MCPGTESAQCAKETAERSVPPDGANATTAAGGGDRQGRRRERRDGALRGSTERSLCYEVLCGVEPTAPQHPSVLPQGIGWKRDRKEGNTS